MTPEKIKQVCDRYLEEFKRWRPERHNTLTHADDSGAVMRHVMSKERSGRPGSTPSSS
jgi:pyruvate-formate lyase-activating enzyme